jgi:hypothetical protein
VLGDVLRAAGVHAEPGAGFHHAAIGADVPHAGFGIFRDPLARARKRRRVEARRRYLYRKFLQSHDGAIVLVFPVHLFVHRTALDHDRRDRFLARLGPFLGDLVRVALKSHAIDPARARQARHHYGNGEMPSGQIGHVGKQNRFSLALRQAAKLEADERTQLRVFVDFAIDPHQQTRRVERGEMFAHVFEIGHRIKTPFVERLRAGRRGKLMAARRMQAEAERARQQQERHQ